MARAQEYKRPLPIPDVRDKGFWDSCKNHELRVQKCKNCGTLRFIPQPMCAKCYSMDIDWVKISGKGKIYTYTIVEHPIAPAFADIAPYAVILVELDEGEALRIVSNLIDCKPQDIRIGMPVEVVFEDVTEEITLPKFRLSSSD